MKKRKKPQQRTRKIAISLLFGASILTLAIIFFFNLITSFSGYSQNIVITSSNLGQQSNNVFLLHLTDKEQDNLLLVLNGQETIELEKYGKYNLQAVQQLLKLDKQSAEKIRWVFSDLFSVAVNQVVEVDLSELDRVDILISKDFKKMILANLKKTKDVKKIVALLQMQKWFEDVDVVTLTSLSELRGEYDNLSITTSLDYQNCPVVLVNASDRVGIASELSEVLEHAGVKVVGVEGEREKESLTTIYYQDKECGSVMQVLEDVLSTTVVKQSNRQVLLDKFRASIVVFLGNDSF